MREICKSGSVEGVMGNHDSYSDSTDRPRLERRRQLKQNYPQRPHRYIRQRQRVEEWLGSSPAAVSWQIDFDKSAHPSRANRRRS